MSRGWAARTRHGGGANWAPCACNITSNSETGTCSSDLVTVKMQVELQEDNTEGLMLELEFTEEPVRRGTLAMVTVKC